MDYILILVFVSNISILLSNGITSIVVWLHHSFNDICSDNILVILNVVENNIPTSSSSNVTNPQSVNVVNRTVQDSYTHGGWPDTVRSIFIYGTGMLRYVASKSSAGRTITIASTIATDYGSQLAKRAFEDPKWVREHMDNWTFMKQDSDGFHFDASSDSEAVNIITKPNDSGVNNFIDSNLSLDVFNFSNNSNFNLNNFLEELVKFLKLNPVSVDYPQTLLADQHHFLALALIILSVSAIFLFITFMINVIIFSYRDKMITYFKNKYILMYLNLNFKIQLAELIFIAITLIFNMYHIILISHFLFTHPIIIS